MRKLVRLPGAVSGSAPGRQLFYFVLMLILSLGLAGGCSEQDSTPRFTRVFVSDYCGTAPLSVEFAAFVTGGEQNDHATGGNMWHDIEWDYGDGETGLGSITYHIYAEPGSYDVRVVARDKNGATAEATALIAVLSDTLMVSASSVPPADAFVMGGRDTIQFYADVEGCDFTGGNGGVERWLDYSWHTDTGIRLSGPMPRFAFSAIDGGQNHDVILTIKSAALNVVRKDTIGFFVVPPPRLWLMLEVDMSEVQDISPSGVFVAGNFNNWNHGVTPMTKVENMDLWRVTIEVARNSNQSFRFVNGIDGAGSESVPAACSAGANSRLVRVDLADVWYNCSFGKCPE